MSNAFSSLQQELQEFKQTFDPWLQSEVVSGDKKIYKCNQEFLNLETKDIYKRKQELNNKIHSLQNTVLALSHNLSKCSDKEIELIENQTLPQINKLNFYIKQIEKEIKLREKNLSIWQKIKLWFRNLSKHRHLSHLNHQGEITKLRTALLEKKFHVHTTAEEVQQQLHNIHAQLKEKAAGTWALVKTDKDREFKLFAIAANPQNTQALTKEYTLQVAETGYVIKELAEKQLLPNDDSLTKPDIETTQSFQLQKNAFVLTKSEHTALEEIHTNLKDQLSNFFHAIPASLGTSSGDPMELIKNSLNTIENLPNGSYYAWKKVSDDTYDIYSIQHQNNTPTITKSTVLIDHNSLQIVLKLDKEEKTTIIQDAGKLHEKFFTGLSPISLPHIRMQAAAKELLKIEAFLKDKNSLLQDTKQFMEPNKKYIHWKDLSSDKNNPRIVISIHQKSSSEQKPTTKPYIIKYTEEGTYQLSNTTSSEVTEYPDLQQLLSSELFKDIEPVQTAINKLQQFQTVKETFIKSVQYQGICIEKKEDAFEFTKNLQKLENVAYPLCIVYLENNRPFALYSSDGSVWKGPVEADIKIGNDEEVLFRFDSETTLDLTAHSETLSTLIPITGYIKQLSLSIALTNTITDSQYYTDEDIEQVEKEFFAVNSYRDKKLPKIIYDTQTDLFYIYAKHGFDILQYTLNPYSTDIQQIFNSILLEGINSSDAFDRAIEDFFKDKSALLPITSKKQILTEEAINTYNLIQEHIYISKNEHEALKSITEAQEKLKGSIEQDGTYVLWKDKNDESIIHGKKIIAKDASVTGDLIDFTLKLAVDGTIIYEEAEQSVKKALYDATSIEFEQFFKTTFNLQLSWIKNKALLGQKIAQLEKQFLGQNIANFEKSFASSQETVQATIPSLQLTNTQSIWLIRYSTDNNALGVRGWFAEKLKIRKLWHMAALTLQQIFNKSSASFCLSFISRKNVSSEKAEYELEDFIINITTNNEVAIQSKKYKNAQFTKEKFGSLDQAVMAIDSYLHGSTISLPLSQVRERFSLAQHKLKEFEANGIIPIHDERKIENQLTTAYKQYDKHVYALYPSAEKSIDCTGAYIPQDDKLRTVPISAIKREYLFAYHDGEKVQYVSFDFWSIPGRICINNSTVATELKEFTNFEEFLAKFPSSKDSLKQRGVEPLKTQSFFKNNQVLSNSPVHISDAYIHPFNIQEIAQSFHQFFQKYNTLSERLDACSSVLESDQTNELKRAIAAFSTTHKNWASENMAQVAILLLRELLGDFTSIQVKDLSSKTRKDVRTILIESRKSVTTGEASNKRNNILSEIQNSLKDYSEKSISEIFKDIQVNILQTAPSKSVQSSVSNSTEVVTKTTQASVQPKVHATTVPQQKTLNDKQREDLIALFDSIKNRSGNITVLNKNQNNLLHSKNDGIQSIVELAHQFKDKNITNATLLAKIKYPQDREGFIQILKDIGKIYGLELK